MKYSVTTLVALAACVIVLLENSAKAEELTEYSVTLDPDDLYNVTWSFSGSEPDDIITFMVEVETTGWVGIGFSPLGSMTGADIIIAWVDKDGEAYLQDMMGDSNSIPKKDESNDVKLVSATESDGKTTIVFSRKLNTCDDRDRALTVDTTRLIYAFSFKDPSNNVLSPSAYHGADRRGSKSIHLFDPLPLVHHVPENALQHEIKQKHYTIPSNHTTYYCSFHAAPELNRKHHIIGIEPVITSGNEGLVHHMILYACWNITLEHLRGINQTDGVCYTAEMPEFESSCKQIVYAWAIGGGNFYYPEGTGYPLGTGDLESPEFFMIETHYDNPAMKEGAVDSSGLRLIYTPNVRDMDVGTLEAGAVSGLAIPPTAKDFEVVGYCHSSCIDRWIPDEGITLFSYALHAHLLGVKIKAELYRNGKPQEILAIDNQYDFNYQENRLYTEPKKLFPGDTVKVTCTMDASKRSEMTYGGLSSREEMCLAFFGYYPKTSITLCQSMPSFFKNHEDKFYDVLGVEAIPMTAWPFLDMPSSLANVSWNDNLISETQDLTKSTEHIGICPTPAGEFDKIPEIFNVDSYTDIPEPVDDWCRMKGEETIIEPRNTASKYNNNNMLSTLLIMLTGLPVHLF